MIFFFETDSLKMISVNSANSVIAHPVIYLKISEKFPIYFS